MALGRTHHLAAGVQVALPLGLVVLLALMRSDLLAPMTGHLFGYLAAAAVMVLAGGGAAAALLGWWLIDRFVKRERRRLRGVLSFVVGAVTVLLFTVPSVFVVLFSPVAFAFMYGEHSAPPRETGTAPSSDVSPLLPKLP
ncbi:MAG: hypothetical protein ACYC8T_22990 [Myxococcaceae bacterium]